MAVKRITEESILDGSLLTDSANYYVEQSGVLYRISTEALKDKIIGDISTAESDDVGKALKVKTVVHGVVTEWEFGETASSESIAEAVSDYLDEHLTNPTNPPIDTSLSIAGAAADSKAAGDGLAELLSKITSLASSLADAYSPYSTYEVGDYVVYGNRLYKCSTAIETAEVWTAGHWTATTIMGEISNNFEEVSF